MRASGANAAELERLGQEVDKSRKARVVKGTSNNYPNNQLRFLKWLVTNSPASLNRLWLSELHQVVKERPLQEGEPIPDLDNKAFKDAARDRLRN